MIQVRCIQLRQRFNHDKVHVTVDIEEDESYKRKMGTTDFGFELQKVKTLRLGLFHLDDS